MINHFKPSKYISTYFKIISNPNKLNEDYTENHHILPKCLFPEFIEDKNNLVALSAREHYIVHMLLYKHYKSVNDKNGMIKMMWAWNMMAKCSNSKMSRNNSKHYSLLKNILSERQKGVKRPKSVGEKISKSRKGIVPWNKGIPCSDETKKKCSDAMIGKNVGKTRSAATRKQMSETHKNKYKNGYINPRTGTTLSDEHKKQISKKLLGKNNPFYGKTHSKETLQRIAKASSEKVTCPHCKKVGGKSGMKRWHFEKCKEK